MINRIKEKRTKKRMNKDLTVDVLKPKIGRG
jgi:hypothetical protein